MHVPYKRGCLFSLQSYTPTFSSFITPYVWHKPYDSNTNTLKGGTRRILTKTTTPLSTMHTLSLHRECATYATKFTRPFPLPDVIGNADIVAF